MAWKSPSEVNTSAGLGEFVPYLSEVTNFWFGRMLMIAVFVIFFFGYLRTNKDDYMGAFAVTSFVSFVVGLIFWVIGWVTGIDFGIVVGIFVISLVVLLTRQNN